MDFLTMSLDERDKQMQQELDRQEQAQLEANQSQASEAPDQSGAFALDSFAK